LFILFTLRIHIRFGKSNLFFSRIYTFLFEHLSNFLCVENSNHPFGAHLWSIDFKILKMIFSWFISNWLTFCLHRFRHWIIKWFCIILTFSSYLWIFCNISRWIIVNSQIHHIPMWVTKIYHIWWLLKKRTFFKYRLMKIIKFHRCIHFRFVLKKMFLKI